MFSLPPELAVTGGLSTALLALVVFGVRQVLTGKLVPRVSLEDAQRDRDYWRQVAEKALTQNSQLVTAARVAEQHTTPEGRR